jgi:hypothetical protein
VGSSEVSCVIRQGLPGTLRPGADERGASLCLCLSERLEEAWCAFGLMTVSCGGCQVVDNLLEKADKNSDGVLDKRELLHVCFDTESSFSVLDTDGDGNITLEEAEVFVARLVGLHTLHCRAI